DVLKLKEMASESQYDSINSAIASITSSIQSINLSRDALETVLGGVATAPAAVSEDAPTVLPHTTGSGVITMAPQADPWIAGGSGRTDAGLDRQEGVYRYRLRQLESAPLERFEVRRTDEQTPVYVTHYPMTARWTCSVCRSPGRRDPHVQLVREWVYG